MRVSTTFVAFLVFFSSATFSTYVLAAPVVDPNERTTPPDLIQSAKQESGPEDFNNQGYPANPGAETPVKKISKKNAKKKKTLAEIGSEPAKQAPAQASDAQIKPDSGLLTLKDPGLIRAEPDWKWLVGLRVQTLAPAGNATLGNGQSFSLSSVGETTYPILEVGLNRKVYDDTLAIWNFGLRAEGGYISQNSNVTYAQTGVKADSSYLTTNILALAAIGSVRFQKFSYLEFELGWNEGQVAYTQSASGGGGGNFTETDRYGGPIVGIMGWLSERWAISLEEEQRHLRGNTTVGLQSDNLSLGVRALW